MEIHHISATDNCSFEYLTGCKNKVFMAMIYYTCEVLKMHYESAYNEVYEIVKPR